MRKVSLVLAGAIMGAGLTGLATQTHLLSSTSAVAASADVYRSLNLFGDIFEKIRTDYVDKPDEQKLIESAINGMVSSLDPHSSYLDAKSFREMDTDMRGQFGGLGIEVTMEDGVLKVAKPIKDTPASKAGILANDIIKQIDGQDVKGLSLTQAVDKMRGLINTQVTLKIDRAGKPEPLDFTLTRSTIVVPAVEERVEGDIAYIRIGTFSEQTYDGLRKAIDKLTNEIGADKLKGYIIDLRNNRGGRLDQSVLVSDAFLDRGRIVSTRGRNAEETQVFNAKSGDLTKGKPVVVLINGSSASAAEIVAGALQDHKRATLIGTRSFGKGSVQTVIPLGSNGGLRLTTARYYTPSGNSIQAKGISPDIEVQQDIPQELKDKIAENKGEASLKGHLKAGEGEEQSGSSSYVPSDPKKDSQLIAAVDLLHGVKKDAIAKSAEKQAADTVSSPKAEAPATPAPVSPAPETPAPAAPEAPKQPN
ncbi:MULTISPECIES: S41 family peptidase [unclassified Bosea (in: a-proteobacteria)]|uniref:S41 family peptidase n=1 Tax=unclassified Bosea (in: a-proteobacteria) TaxID=2653178 RepID=UPI0009F8BE01|nr:MULTISPECIES: S41 family peptidase [unclassified Bosea (in: a-proteobacteria)]TAJ28811.1 MAG: PDZ domain-containing protein [Bosea sp. (in: a-proteobacteria)]